VELNSRGRATGRRFVCPPNQRGSTCRPAESPRRHVSRAERAAHQRRWRRIEYYNSPRGRKVYAQRGQSVEPLHDRLKSLFDLNSRVWHRGLGNNKTQLLIAIFCYQLLLRYNHRCGHRNAQVQWIMESV